MATNVSVGQDERARGRITDLVRWGAVAAGVVIGLGFFAVLNALWLALGSGTGNGWVTGNLDWLVGGTAAFALMLAGFLAGFFAGPRGKAAGLANGVTAWGLLFLLSLTAVIPGAVNLTNNLAAGLGGGSTSIGSAIGEAGGGFSVQSVLWSGFWALLAGLVLASVGGLIGGMMRRPVVSSDEHSRGDRAVTPVPTTMTDNHIVEREPITAVREDARR